MNEDKALEQISENEMFELMKTLIVKAGVKTSEYYNKVGLEVAIKKNDSDLVTEADLKSNDIICDGIKNKYPNHGIISEENKIFDDQKDYVWVIDPLDGTHNFTNKIPMYAILIGLARKGEVIAGAAYMPQFNYLYFASKGQGAFKNGKPIHCSTKEDLMNSIGAGFIDISGPYKEQVRKFSESSQVYHQRTTEVLSGAVDMMLVSEGKRAWYFMPTHSGGVWDNAAPSVILKESGCKVTNFNGEDWKLSDNTEMIAANPKIHKQIFYVIN